MKSRCTGNMIIKSIGYLLHCIVTENAIDDWKFPGFNFSNWNFPGFIFAKIYITHFTKATIEKAKGNISYHE